MKKMSVILVLILAFLFAGCPLDSEYDLGSAMLSNIDTRLLGKWQNLTDTTGKYLLVERDTDPEYPDYVKIYLLKTANQDKNDENVEMFWARFAKVNGSEYFVVEYFDELWSVYVEHYYYYYKVVDSKNITVKDVNPDYAHDETIKTGEELKAYFNSNQSKPDFLINETKYRKI
ncbi:MAG: hypothetical protein R6V49_11420 [Bacteroidales bacterium]